LRSESSERKFGDGKYRTKILGPGISGWSISRSIFLNLGFAPPPLPLGAKRIT